MQRSWSRRMWLKLALLAPLGLTSTGCGTILHPERRGQPAGQLDWGIVLLDAIGLLLFFIPGVIAFAVDFTNGTIYLPPCACVDATQGRRAGKLIAFDVPPDELTPARVQQIVAAKTRRPVTLVPGAYQTQELKQLDDYWPACDALAAG